MKNLLERTQDMIMYFLFPYYRKTLKALEDVNKDLSGEIATRNNLTKRLDKIIDNCDEAIEILGETKLKKETKDILFALLTIDR